jgi:bifunctional non-homologous end joining protein LigD
MTPSVRLTSFERVLFPDARVTKGDLFAYYDAVADALVPHLRDRPFTMKRFREGIRGHGFFQKQAPKGMPSWIATRTFQTVQRSGQTRMVDFPLVQRREALLWMVQMHCIDMNVWNARHDRPDRPDWVVFDLDPPDGDFGLGVRAAHLVHERLDALGLRSYAKTSGSEGIHVFVPVARRHTHGDAHAFAEALARELEAANPGVVTTEWLKRKREGVLVDYHQNGWGKTMASVYSVRPKPGAPVSTPLRWQELTEELRPRDFTMDVVRGRLARDGDLFAPVLEGGQTLTRAARELGRGAPPPRRRRGGRARAA